MFTLLLKVVFFYLFNFIYFIFFIDYSFVDILYYKLLFKKDFV